MRTITQKNLPVCVYINDRLILETIPEANIVADDIISVALDDEEKRRIADTLSKKYNTQISADAITIDESRLNVTYIDL